jgi:hypothetical protein
MMSMGKRNIPWPKEKAPKIRKSGDESAISAPPSLNENDPSQVEAKTAFVQEWLDNKEPSAAQAAPEGDEQHQVSTPERLLGKLKDLLGKSVTHNTIQRICKMWKYSTTGNLVLETSHAKDLPMIEIHVDIPDEHRAAFASYNFKKIYAKTSFPANSLSKLIGTQYLCRVFDQGWYSPC